MSEQAGMMDTATASTTLAKLQRRLEELQQHPSLVAGAYTAYAPRCVDAEGNRLYDMERRLRAAVGRDNPAQLHVHVTRYGAAPDIVVLDDNRAHVLHDGRKHAIPLEHVENYWLQDGHRVPDKHPGDAGTADADPPRP